MSDNIRVEVLCTKAINFAMQQNGVPIVRQVTIHNDGTTPLRDIELRLTTSPGFARPWNRKIDLVAAESNLSVSKIDMVLIPDELGALTEKMVGSLQIETWVGGENLITDTQEMEWLAYDQWAGLGVMPEMLAAFVTPNHPVVPTILAKAGVLLEKWTGSPAFTGYQTQDPNKVRIQMAAIYGAIQQQNIMYVQAPASFEAAGQRIRSCQTILQDKMGNCLDLSLLFASCLEAVSIHPLIVCTEGHAFVGCWLEKECFPECVQDDASLLTKRISSGIYEITVAECTAMCANDVSISFEQAERMAAKNLEEQPFDLVLDILRARNSGIRPMPQRIDNGTGGYTFENHTLRPEVSSTAIAPLDMEVYGKLEYVDAISIDKQQLWERKLLDLSLRNPLVSFRPTRNSIQLLSGNLSRLEDAISSGEEFQILHKPQDLDSSEDYGRILKIDTDKTILEHLVDAEFKSKRLRTYLSESEIAGRVTHLYRQAKNGLEENGANTLFLALGFLRWYEKDISEKPRFAPLVLVPIDIVRKSALKGYIIRARDEEVQMNITLLELLRQDHGISIGGLDVLPQDEHGVDLGRIFSIVRQAILSKPRWEVDELAFLGIFSFGQFVMWNDIRNRADDIRKNKVVASLLSGKMEWKQEKPFPEPELLDDLYAPSDLAVPTSTDSSQLTAICAASEGSTFVLHGPPGTGKSQTITNIIANMLFQGKRVLFIAEKMAALSVVQKRLSDIGLGNFSLEVHSNKARKKDVLEQLNATLNIGKIKPPEQYDSEAERLHELRKKLNGIMNAIHRKRPCGVSLYEAITQYEKHRKISNNLEIDVNLARQTTQAQHMQWMECIDKLVIAAKNCGNVSEHPLKEIALPTYPVEGREAFFRACSQMEAALQDLQSCSKQSRALLGIELSGSYRELSGLNTLFNLLLEQPVVPHGLFSTRQLEGYASLIKDVCIAGVNCYQLSEQLKQGFTEQIFTYDESIAKASWQAADGKWILPKYIEQNKIYKQLRVLNRVPKQFDKQSVVAVLDTLAAYKYNRAIIDRNANQFASWYGMYWNGEQTDFTLLQDMYQKTIDLQKAIFGVCESLDQKNSLEQRMGDLYFEDPSAFSNMHGDLLQKQMESYERCVLLGQQLQDTWKAEIVYLYETPEWVEKMLSTILRWRNNATLLRDWCIYISCRENANQLGLQAVVDLLSQGTAAIEQIPAIFEKALYRKISELIIAEDIDISNFSGLLLETDIRHYREVCQTFEALTKQELAARLSAKVPNGQVDAAQSSELGLLKRAIGSGGRGISIRKLFEQIPNLLGRLAPCMLMSPISVAQYIDPSHPQFDLVIFDEASQLPTCEAVGAIARGENLIVVGDPKQLPPTSFFASTRTDEDNYETEDLESILNDCLALSIPETYLAWHYRSRHESLIAFSNMQYYESRLYTFPSPNDLKSEVTFKAVKGFYDRSKTRQNRAEGEAIVSEIVRRLSNAQLMHQSIGVVTFSSTQQQLIEDLLQDAFAKHPNLDDWNSAQSEPIFIKNLENVQGDERDVILFSVGYGPDSSGKVSLNFGPLNRDGGWRRLNVAVTRARHSMEVYSTLQPEQINLSKTRAEGVAGLRAFLEFAKYGKSALNATQEVAGQEMAAVVENIALALVEDGWNVKTSIGTSQYKVDIGVVHPSVPEQYVLGIMLDGMSYQSAATSRDRNILQDSVLKGLGWTIHHIWAIDWLHNPKKELERVRTAIEIALENEDSHMEKSKEDTQATDSVIESYERLPMELQSEVPINQYKIANLAKIPLHTDEFYSLYRVPLLAEQIGQIVQLEAPICKELLTKRLINSWGMTRAGNRINGHVQTILRRMKLPHNKTLSVDFYWQMEQNPEEFSVFRIPQVASERREIYHIPKEEIASAICYVLKNQIGLTTDDLKRETYKLLGFSRIGQSMDEVITAGIQYAIKRGWAIHEDERIILVE